MKLLFENWRKHLKETAAKSVKDVRRLVKPFSVDYGKGMLDVKYDVPLSKDLSLVPNVKAGPGGKFAGVALKGTFEEGKEEGEPLEEDLEDFDKRTLEAQPELNPDLWQEGRVTPQIREALLQIATDCTKGS